MNRNHLKIIACLSMLIDHMGILMFPQYQVFRYIGRLAFPIFAFFIGEGCRYTKHRKKYLLSLFILGAACQAVYIIEEFIGTGSLGFSSGAWYFNILLTFSVSVPLCYLVLDLKTAESKKKNALCLGAYLLAVSAGAVLFWSLRKMGGSFELDYGIFGIILPVSTLIFNDKKGKLTAFFVTLTAFCLFSMKDVPFIWFSLLSLPLLLLYNEKSGSKRLKYGFYIFYPAHLAALYLLSMIFFQ